MTKKNELVTFLNPYSYLVARRYPLLFEKMTTIHIDGILLVILLKFFRLKNLSRKSFDMSSLAPIVFSTASKEEKTVYIIGTTKESIHQAIEKIQKKFSALEIAGFRDGYFSNQQEREKEIMKIVSISPDYVVCGMGTPLQELFLVDLHEAGWKGTGYTCGGFLHQTAHKIDYYPLWINEFHLRWLYRIYKEPQLIKRLLRSYPLSILFFINDVFSWKVLKKDNLLKRIINKFS